MYQPPPQQPESHRRRSPLPWLLAAGALAIAAVTVALVVNSQSGHPDTSTPEAVAQAGATAFGNNDVDAMVEIACDADDDFRDDFGRMATDTGPSGGPQGQVASAKVDRVVHSDGDSGDPPTAMAGIAITYTHGTTRTPVLLISQANDGWCVSGISY